MNLTLDSKGAFIKKAFKLSPVNLPKQTKETLAAVIVPFLFKDNSWFLIFEKKPMDNSKHAGQIGFPGGSKENEDQNLLQTALRETCEEINICTGDLEIIGNIKPIKTLSTNFLVFPFIAIIKKQPPYKINPSEVEKLLFVPLEFLLKNYPIKYSWYNYKGHKIKTPLITYQNEIIWGATARLLNKLLPKFL